MSWLANLIQFGNLQSTTLELCQSPKLAHPPVCPSAFSTHKQAIDKADRPRSTSQSLSKISMFTSNQKIDPKERIIHRLVYKLQMKCRKHFYNFFVKLENCKKKPTKAKDTKLILALPKVIPKLDQISNLLYSKYFQRAHKKDSFDSIKKQSKAAVCLKKICSLMSKRKCQEYFSRLNRYCQHIQKNNMRIDILVSSLKSIVSSFARFNNIQLLASAFKKISTNILHRLQQNTHFKTSSNSKQHLGLSKMISQKIKDPFQKANSMKSYSVHCQLTQQPLQNTFSQDVSSCLSKRSEVDWLNPREVYDLYDNSKLFIQPALLDTLAGLAINTLQKPKPISQNQPQIQPKKHTSNQISINFRMITGESNSQYHSESSSSLKSFGLQAIVFKNSLISGRQSTNQHIKLQAYKTIAQPQKQKNVKQQYPAETNSCDKNTISNSLRLRVDNQIVLKNNSAAKPPNQKLGISMKSSTPINSARYPDHQNTKTIISSRKNIGQSKIGLIKEGLNHPKFLKITKKM